MLLAFTRSRNPMVLVDADRRQVDANGAYLRLLGYRRDALLGEPLYSFVAGGPVASAAEWRAALAERRFTGEAELVCADATHCRRVTDHA
jgi:PAS domain S-box-containing protein